MVRPEAERSCGGDGGDSCDISAGYGRDDRGDDGKSIRPSLLLLLTRREMCRRRRQVSGLWLKRSVPVLGEMIGIAGDKLSLIKSVRFDVLAASGVRWR